jgi:hypothetical protein
LGEIFPNGNFFSDWGKFLHFLTFEVTQIL